MRIRLVLKNGTQSEFTIVNMSDIDVHLAQLGFSIHFVRTVQFLGV